MDTPELPREIELVGHSHLLPDLRNRQRRRVQKVARAGHLEAGVVGKHPATGGVAEQRTQVGGRQADQLRQFGHTDRAAHAFLQVTHSPLERLALFG